MQFQNRRDVFNSYEELFDATLMQEIMKSPGELPTKTPDSEYKLLSSDAGVINRFCTRYHIMYSTKRVTIMQAKYLFNEAASLIKYLQNEYHFKS